MPTGAEVFDFLRCLHCAKRMEKKNFGLAVCKSGAPNPRQIVKPLYCSTFTPLNQNLPYKKTATASSLWLFISGTASPRKGQFRISEQSTLGIGNISTPGGDKIIDTLYE